MKNVSLALALNAQPPALVLSFGRKLTPRTLHPLLLNQTVRNALGNRTTVNHAVAIRMCRARCGSISIRTAIMKAKDLRCCQIAVTEAQLTALK